MLDRTPDVTNDSPRFSTGPQNGLAAPDGSPPGVILRAMILDGIMTARECLRRSPDAEAVAAARRELREARWCFKVFRKAMGPAYPARAARLQAGSRAMKHLARLLAADPAAQPEAVAELVAAADALLRRCEGDAVALAPFQAGTAQCKAHLRKLRRKIAQTTAGPIQTADAQDSVQKLQARIALISNVLVSSGEDAAGQAEAARTETKTQIRTAPADAPA